MFRLWDPVCVGLFASSVIGCAFGNEDLDIKKPTDAGADSGVTVADSGWGVGGNSGYGGYAGAGGLAGGAGFAGSAGSGTGGTGALPGGPCTPGEKQSLGPCEKCGTSERVCSSAGQWHAPTCESQGVCNSGEQATEACCTACGARSRT
ncbi:MAG TPA: hypothetical protein PKA88_33870, partial [Polyangiaceae bacterium]|nr:hypothetical protein [Polyangiaceae bacterium]